MFLLICISSVLFLFWLFMYYKAVARFIQFFSKPKANQQDIITKYLDRYHKRSTKPLANVNKSVEPKEIRLRTKQQKLNFPTKKPTSQKVFSKNDIQKAMIFKELLDNKPEDLFKR